MSTLDNFSFANFERLDDFPTYTSMIKSFGKPIIPPLLTPHKRELYSQLRNLTFLEKKSSKKTEYSFKSCEKNKETNDDISFTKTRNSSVSSKFSNSENSALSFLTSKNVNNYLPTNEMFVSTCKMPCSGVCSTVHDTVIVCPNEAKVSNENISTEPETVDSETCESYSENDCDCRSCQIQLLEVPYKSIHTEQRNSVSEDEHEFITGETEFESLSTVICNRIHPTSDTDTESIATYITQSTDLDKYMDCPIEFSSPDDVGNVSLTQNSSLRSVSTKSEDASTETIIYTENELSPSASTLTGLNGNSGGSNNNVRSFTSFSEAADTNFYNRSFSVDSYMFASRTCGTELYFRNSESEPLRSHINENENASISVLKIDTFNTNCEEKTQLTQNISDTMLDTVKRGSNDLLSSTETSSDSEFKPVLEKSIRRNSYTLLQPSPALIEAHADCCCQNNPNDTSPYSCSSQQQNTSVNVAFKKEMVELVLPPMKDRDKMFPILNYEESKIVDISEKELGSEKNSGEDKSTGDFKSLPNSEISSDVSEKLITNFQENLSVLEKPFSPTEISPNLEKSVEKDSIENDCSNEILMKLFKELKESHQLRATELMEEQNKQWLRLQEEFKDQERRLFEKLNSSGIVLSSGNNSLESSTTSVASVKSSVQIPVNSLYISSCGSDSYSSDSSSETLPTVIQNTTEKTLCSNNELNFISSINCDLSKNCDLMLDNVTETSHDLYSACEENGELIRTNTCQSNSSTSLQENVEQEVPNSVTGYLKQNVVDVKQSNSAISFIRNEVISFDSDQNTESEASFPFFSATSIVLPSKRANKTSTEIYTAEDIQSNAFNLNEENSIFCNKSIQPTVQLQTSKMSKNAQMNFNLVKDSCNANEFDTMHESNVVNFKAGVNNSEKSPLSDANIISDSSDINFNDRSEEDPIPPSRFEDFSQTYLTSDNPVKKIKVSSSLTTLKRRISRDVNDPEFLRQMKKIPAMVKGYLTRRLLKTEKIKGMLQTMQESVILLQNLSEESKKGNPISEQDEELRQKLLHQLLTTYEEFYDIFFTISLKERLDLIAQSRNYRLKKLEAAKQKSISSVNSNQQTASNSSSKSSLQKNMSNSSLRSSIHQDTTSTSSVNSTHSDTSKMNDHLATFSNETEKHTLHHCAQRKKRSLIDCRTYTKEDFKECQARACSTSSLKSQNKTPTRIYQTSVGTNMNRKVKSLVRPIQTKPWK